MPRYNVIWSGLDTANAEFTWEVPNWWKIFRIIAQYEGQLYTDLNLPLYEELNKSFPDKSWISTETNGSKRSFFRDSSVAWTRTGVLDLHNKKFIITPLGHDALAGKITFPELLLRALLKFTYKNENPFSILATAFLNIEQPLTEEQLYLGIMQNYRYGDDLDEALSYVGNSQIPDGNSKRRFISILRLLKYANAINEFNDKKKWIAWDYNVLRQLATSDQSDNLPVPQGINQITQTVIKDFSNAGLLYDSDFIRRFIASLLTKPFVILTGLSGSGKTKLAQAFAQWIAPKNASEIVAVGADWTNSEQILGYPNALSQDEYVNTRSLNLIIKASKDPGHPYFLILDEMNLSHVERYFADILSAIESGGDIYLHGNNESRQDIPPSITLPTNLFIIGTVNIDETTYMFSPKVLDRANTLEFRITKKDMEIYLNNPIKLDIQNLAELGETYAKAFVTLACNKASLTGDQKEKFDKEIMLFFEVLHEYGAEFGFRTISEIARYIFVYNNLFEDSENYQYALDSQILQKILPKLHGSRRQLEPILCALAHLCYQVRQWGSMDGMPRLENAEELLKKAKQAALLEDETLHPLFKDVNGVLVWEPTNQVPLCLSYEKIYRMLQRLEMKGFTSFAEA